MTGSSARTVLFADLRGSTALFGTLGNAQAAAVVTQTIGLLSRVVTQNSGKVVKTLGDGLMALFERGPMAVRAAREMQDSIARIMAEADTGAAALRLYVAMAHGEIVEVAGDSFGDAVNVAARLLDHAGDNEVLITQQVYEQLAAVDRQRFKSLERLHLRGRSEPCHVYRLESWYDDDATPSTLFADFTDTPLADCIRLALADAPQQVFTVQQMPVVIGRSPDSTFCIDDSRVSRLHARIEWHGGNFHLSDQSSNGSFVRFTGDHEVVMLRRGVCVLHGSGVIGLGASPADSSAAVLHFEVFSLASELPIGGS
ncbi:adenylate/guanylate cyclase domain-containing protein [Caldimonas thermodepolymerans]|jgi:Adenylate cyclase, family 3 (some proteins contain HAMP domain)|uniref:Adenylate/guanylate cyclase domain-containing protein n=1 Tax=Caldimonas thermodepolymerans TaxID=215580 RepID=A0A2S5T600_9BURK|nr:adenylate/guanylate cyclase domain-containing protein [Caldimonas thermodepolymerans]PPE70372.1 adenylate/guanylate cyclase domain-containing protein [Caldimonas thermodepolymerans]QPC30280.1 adenylate/guanylate cyclase domain-containing protein [Caldimonas thermodepolymerans]RDI00674.1 class 3 adenylate cyclase [Caldimonas thermodepolymerans]TCP07047.1 class 3 adenylate cyclase [Caldimonas thermodepolymerans]UZG43041.1 adenylate/guanylate cyclase domain-containing protein [Caldimonas therm